jgi:hypothetical protein
MRILYTKQAGIKFKNCTTEIKTIPALANSAGSTMCPIDTRIKSHRLSTIEWGAKRNFQLKKQRLPVSCAANPSSSVSWSALKMVILSVVTIENAYAERVVSPVSSCPSAKCCSNSSMIGLPSSRPEIKRSSVA